MLNLSDLQGLIRSGYNHLPYARFLFYHVESSEVARDWLAAAIPEVSTADHWHHEHTGKKPPTRVQIAFTCEGLARLGLTDDALETFPREFREGMAGPNRSPVLGDLGEEAPEYWEVGGRGTPEVHALAMLYGKTEQDLDALVDRLWNPSAHAPGMKEIYRQDSFRGSANEPFGFRDGVSQPAIEGVTDKVLPGPSPVKMGEFILGYDNEYDQPPPMPSVPAAADPGGVLPVSSVDASRRELGRNGTYLVWRKLAQDVAGFWAFMDERTKGPDGKSDAEKQKQLAAKFVGRWPSGAPLVLSPDRDDPELGADKRRNNDFLFMPTDPDGYACPIGSHMRRVNPRDSLQQASPRESMVIAKRRRLLRRGRPYGTSPAAVAEGAEQGLAFIVINADLEHQFEFVQQTWVNSTKFGGLYDSTDPLVGECTGDRVLVIQRKPVRQQIHNLPPFVKVKGGGYFFLPSLTALRFLARGKDR